MKEEKQKTQQYGIEKQAAVAIAEEAENSDDEADDGEVIDDEDEADFELIPKLVAKPENLRHLMLSHNSTSKKSIKPLLTIFLGDQFTGTAFVSQAINQRDDAFALFEPLGMFGQSCEKDLDIKVRLIQQLGHCGFPLMTDIAANHFK